MNIIEGASRMQRAGRALVILALSAFTLCALGAGICALLPSLLHVREILGVLIPLVFGAVWLCTIALLLGAVLWIAGWILEGFFHHAR